MDLPRSNRVLMARIEHDNKYGYINQAGEMTISPQLIYATDFKEGLAVVANEDGNLQYINRHGRVQIRPIFFQADEFSEGLAAIEANDLWGYMGTSGDPIFPNRYQKAGHFIHGLAPVVENGEFKYSDVNGNHVITPQKDNDIITQLGDFYGDLACF